MTTKRRKVLSLFLALILSVSALPISRVMSFALTSGDFEYEVLSETDKTCEISGYTGSETSMAIPSIIDGYAVASIGAYAFQECSSLISITIPESVTSIGEGAFYGCTSITSITIPNSVTSIDTGAFYGCSSLTSVIIPGSVTSIGAYAFQECTLLISITIPESVTSIGEGAFALCTSLQNIEVDAKNSVYSSVGGVLFNKEQTELNCYPAGKTNTSYTIPESVTNISSYAFLGCTSLTNVIISDGVTIIGEYAFFSCPSLEDITIPDSVTEIGFAAFEDCSSLASITIPDSVTSIANDAFNGTAYYNTESNWENDVLYIGNHLIKVRNTLNGDCNIKQGTKTIQGEAFYGCTSLTSVTIPNSVTSIGGRAFSSCTSLSRITIPSSVTDIGEYAFEGCTSLTSITLPDSVTDIGEYAFLSCTSLTSITIPDGVTYISNGAFYNCTSLTSVIIPDSVTSIGEYAFWGCQKIKILGFDSSAAKTYAAENSIEFCLMGDIDGNGAYESNDYSMLAAQAKFQTVNTTAPREVGDINLDGAVDAFDAIQLDLYLHNATDIHGNKIA